MRNDAITVRFEVVDMGKTAVIVKPTIYYGEDNVQELQERALMAGDTLDLEVPLGVNVIGPKEDD